MKIVISLYHCSSKKKKKKKKGLMKYLYVLILNAAPLWYYQQWPYED